MDLKPIFPHVSDRRAAQLINTTVDLEAAIANGVVLNTLFNNAKDTFNRAVEESAKHFLDHTGPQDTDRPHLTALWHGAYHADAFVSNAHGIPSALKRAQKVEALAAYAAFLQALLPLRELLDAAKPLIAKRGDSRIPVVKTAEQIERDANAMTCQCCGRAILANLGSIALHGYERPGHGWQTGSCIGAKELPFEVSRDALGLMIERWQTERSRRIDLRADINAETARFSVEVENRSLPRDRRGRYPTQWVPLSRETFDARKSEFPLQFEQRRYTDFDTCKRIDLAERDHGIEQISLAIAIQQARYDDWKQTHSGFDCATKSWVAL